jgi:hypothetical protein
MKAIWDMVLCSHEGALIMEAANTSETSVYFQETTRRHIPEGCHLHIRSRENPKSYFLSIFLYNVKAGESQLKVVT